MLLFFIKFDIYTNKMQSKLIHLLNEDKVIRGRNIIESRLEEVLHRINSYKKSEFHVCDTDIPEDLSIEGYNLI